MSYVHSFDPVVGANPRVLILGSMPGVASLEVQQYYAHPRNAFWPIMSHLFEVEWLPEYRQRIEQFRALPLGLWDVLASCSRSGSLDSSIVKNSEQVNPVEQLLEQEPSIVLVAFNGVTAEQLFRRFVLRKLPGDVSIDLMRLPSTSPANAARSFQQKLDDWRGILPYLI